MLQYAAVCSGIRNILPALLCDMLSCAATGLVSHISHSFPISYDNFSPGPSLFFFSLSASRLILCHCCCLGPHLPGGSSSCLRAHGHLFTAEPVGANERLGNGCLVILVVESHPTVKLSPALAFFMLFILVLAWLLRFPLAATCTACTGGPL